MKLSVNKILWRTAATAAILGLTPGVVCAQNNNNNNQNNNASASANSSGPALAHVERAANLFGRELVSSDNQKIGKVENVLVDLPAERVMYVLVHTDQGSYIALPPPVVGSSSGQTVRVNATRQKVFSTPKLSQDQLNQASGLAQVYQHFGVPLYWQSGGGSNPTYFKSVHKLNELIGMRVQDPNSKVLGKVSNVVVDMATARLLYAVVQPDSSLNLGNNLYPVPSDALHLTSDSKALTMDSDPQKLAAGPHFASSQWPNLNDVNFASQVYQHYAKSPWFNNPGANSTTPTGR